MANLPSSSSGTDDGFWTRLSQKEDEDPGSSVTSRCGFSWHVASCILLLALFGLGARSGSGGLGDTMSHAHHDVNNIKDDGAEEAEEDAVVDNGLG